MKIETKEYSITSYDRNRIHVVIKEEIICQTQKELLFRHIYETLLKHIDEVNHVFFYNNCGQFFLFLTKEQLKRSL